MDPLDGYQEAETTAEAESALDRLVVAPGQAPEFLGDLYDELATEASEEGDYEVAVRAQRKALDWGCEMPDLARRMLGWYLLKGGWVEEGEEEFSAMRAEWPEDSHLLVTMGNARLDAGLRASALEAFDQALELARRAGEPFGIADALIERKAAREEAGLSPDEDDRLAPRSRMSVGPPEEVRYALSWFPRHQHAAAVRLSPDLADELADPDEYCRGIEDRLRAVASASGRHPVISPLEVEKLAEFAAGEGLDPDSGEARARYSAALSRSGGSLPWPPGRNESCWCGSNRKYKRCCGA